MMTQYEFKKKYPSLDYDFQQFGNQSWTEKYNGKQAIYPTLEYFCTAEHVKPEDLTAALKKYGIDKKDLENSSAGNKWVEETIIRAILANFWKAKQDDEIVEKNKADAEAVAKRNAAIEQRDNDNIIRMRIAQDIKNEEIQKLNAEIEKRFQAEKRRLAK